MLKRSGKAVLAAIGLTLTLGALQAFQKPFRQYAGVEYRLGEIGLPPDWNVSGEFVFARLMYPNGGPMDGYYPRFQGDWREGLSLWTQDYRAPTAIFWKPYDGLREFKRAPLSSR
jgi:hypothetical protein